LFLNPTGIDHRREGSRGRTHPCVDDRRQDPEEGAAAEEAVAVAEGGKAAHPEEPDVGGGQRPLDRLRHRSGAYQGAPRGCCVRLRHSTRWFRGARHASCLKVSSLRRVMFMHLE
ncbi:unnamed protein product, partial [Musa banksii]